MYHRALQASHVPRGSLLFTTALPGHAEYHRSSADTGLISMNHCLQQEVEVWLLWPESLPPEELRQICFPLLSAEEQQRSQRFHFEHDRTHYLAAHALLRLCLGHHLACPPQQVQMATDRNGKPHLAGQFSASPLHFNLSHTGGMVACIVTHSRTCGIDVERIRPLPEMAGMARTVFSAAEIAWLESQEDATRSQAFFTLWTLKEAYIKATGLGMSAPLQKITLDPATLRVEDHSLPAQLRVAWLFDYWHPDPEHALAVACQNTGASFTNAVVYQELDLVTGQRQQLRRRDAGNALQ
ncbi:4'-phosphopantetheinyl transferase superfamily protein [Janthinobacterium sp. 17J80-10]|uniref:4'-phosphopantetheinyl transferase family protein n=1 Tax=Janthinobacterium sp. 17J80-10 TaxID=2497863 RepID=UPI001F508AEC|nr:4'-phosphopantetheinyl transferase superfamily protein [Janthinobacterium sp. 17J80-10]